MKRQSAFYIGTLRHRRFRPQLREFSHRVGYGWIDLDEVESLFPIRFLFSSKQPSLFGFERAALFNPWVENLKHAVLDRVEKDLGHRPNGPVRVLTQLKSFGFAFNPVSFYYCYDETGNHPLAVLSEITNTPWGEKYSYVQSFDDFSLRSDHEFQKEFHVSPFLGMNYRYRWRFNRPGESLSIHMENHKSPSVLPGGVDFDATLTLEKREWSGHLSLLRFMARFALMPIVTLFLIYLHAAMIWLRRIPFHAHPRHSNSAQPEERK